MRQIFYKVIICSCMLMACFVSKAQNAYSIAKGKITGVCKGQRKTAGGYIWKYQDELEIKE